MSKNLVIVESPAKAKTIEKFLGKDYIVKSSFGHIRDLPKKGLNIDIENDFAPKYEISADKKVVVRELKKAAVGNEVWLASDEDREGEAIAWHLAYALKLDPKKTRRIVFHEITKSAIEAAIKNPRTVDEKLVDAQQARRILDRLVGYELSPVLWKKVRTGLSAGRVQSVAVRIIVDREREIQAFTPQSSFKINAIFQLDSAELPAELNTKLNSFEEAKDWLSRRSNSEFRVADITKKSGQRNPSAPFTTSTLQQEASRRLGFSVRQTMTLAQRLYEAGHITYMRTDSTLLSELAQNAIGSFISKEFGQRYYTRRQYKTRSQSAQEAHEAIRPTVISARSAGEDDAQRKLYQLIWQRAVASQMSEAELSRTEITIAISDDTHEFIAKGEILSFDGFLKVYGGGKDDTLLPDLKSGQRLLPKEIAATEQFSRPPARYSEATLVRKLEELGIGRPSTYAPTISTIQSRGYVEKQDLPGTEQTTRRLTLLPDGQLTESSLASIVGSDRAKLLPTHIAEITTDFLVKYFPNIVNYDFTASVEEEFDRIAQGELHWTKIIEDFYKDFHPLVEQSESISRHEVSQARLLGPNPSTGEPIYARFGRYGPMLQQGDTDDEAKKPVFAPMPANATIDTVTLDQALVMFQLPRIVGKTAEGDEIKANIGRFGPYIQVGKTFVSIKPRDPHTISEEEARQLYSEKLAKDDAKNIKQFDNGLKILNGPYGPYITDGKKNARIPKQQDPNALSEAEASEMFKSAPTTKRSFRRRRAKK